MLGIGSRIADNYQVLRKLGKGGMSTVYLAMNEATNSICAIKEIRQDGEIDYSMIRQSLVSETNMLKRLSHPNLPEIMDIIHLEGCVLIVMDYIEGWNLNELVLKQGAQNPAQVIEWGKQICDVLEYLHTRKPAIIYRDLKPSNLILKPDGTLVLIDFGTAREFKNNTAVGDTTLWGTRGYAAPEQFGGMGETSPRTDIYCLGATLYHLLTGLSPAEPPYMMKPIGEWNPSFSGTALERILIRCCQVDPMQRYQSCAELRRDLERIQFGRTNVDDFKITRPRKLGLACLFLAIYLIAIIGMSVANALKSGAEEETYDYYIEKMEDSADDDFDDIEDFCKKAIDIAPERPEAYQVLVERIGKDAEVTFEEMRAIERCIGAKDDNGTELLSHLKESDRESYDYLCYDLGLLYYFMSDEANTMNYNTEKATRYFSRVDDSRYLKRTERQLADSISKIGTYTAKLATQDNSFKREELGYDYAMLWQDYMSIVSGDVVERVGNPRYAVCLYEQVAMQLVMKDNREGFLRTGIKLEDGHTLTLEDIKLEIERIKSQVELIDSVNDESLDKSKSNAISAIDNAIWQINAVLD